MTLTLKETNSDLLDVEEQISNSEDDQNNGIDSDNPSGGSEKESDNENSDTEKSGTNAGWADSVARILKTKKPKGKKSLVLSKAKKLSDVKIKKPTEVGFQIEGDIIDEKPDASVLDTIKEEDDEPAKKKRKELPSIRVKPNILDKDRERTLSKIATQGVVQLFNSVRTQQKDIDQKLKEAGPLERKRENVMKSIDKRAFLDVLMDKKSQSVDGEVKNETKQESKGKSQTDSTWNVLRDDFMMGAKLKDWDKEIEEENDDASEEMSDSD